MAGRRPARRVAAGRANRRHERRYEIDRLLGGHFFYRQCAPARRSLPPVPWRRCISPGGPPGFVAIEADGSLSFPDYVGNFLFNTFGNLAKDPRAGLLFIDFETGDTLQLRGTARVLWDDPRTEGVPGAQRIVSFVPEQAVRICNALGLGWQFIDQSPHIARFLRRGPKT
ncbi:MAG: pyridoxamine 5'-phosphate oxidase family protein [Rhodospirillales bacterium]|nr:pyridoxamine 5'-phosphate oxidase family protein [Rhodospirillales bacterium]